MYGGTRHTHDIQRTWICLNRVYKRFGHDDAVKTPHSSRRYIRLHLDHPYLLLRFGSPSHSGPSDFVRRLRSRHLARTVARGDSTVSSTRTNKDTAAFGEFPPRLAPGQPHPPNPNKQERLFRGEWEHHNFAELEGTVEVLSDAKAKVEPLQQDKDVLAKAKKNSTPNLPKHANAVYSLTQERSQEREERARLEALNKDPEQQVKALQGLKARVSQLELSLAQALQDRDAKADEWRILRRQMQRKEAAQVKKARAGAKLAEIQEENERRLKASREKYPDLRSMFMTLGRHSSNIAHHVDVEVQQGFLSRNSMLYWRWTHEEFKSFRSSLPDTVAIEHKKALSNVERFLRERSKTADLTASLGKKAMKLRIALYAWSATAHDARKATRALRYEDASCAAYRFTLTAGYDHIGKAIAGSAAAVVEKAISEEVLTASGGNATAAAIRRRYETLRSPFQRSDRLMSLRWLLVAPPAEQIAFALVQRSRLADHDLGRMFSVKDEILELFVHNVDIHKALTSIDSSTLEAMRHALWNMFLIRRYAQEKLGQDSDLEHAEALDTIRNLQTEWERYEHKEIDSARRIFYHTQKHIYEKSKASATNISGVEPANFQKRSTIQRLRDGTVTTRHDKRIASKPDATCATGNAIAPSNESPKTTRGVGNQFFSATKPLYSSSTLGAALPNGLDYRIPPEVLNAARSASGAENAVFWSYMLFRSPAGERVRVHYCRSKDAAEKAVRHFQGERIVGFDMEWEAGAQPGRNSIKDSISVVQLASESRVAIIHLALFTGKSAHDLMPPSLKAILESATVLKAGVNVAGDFGRLRKCFGIEGKGLFELSHLYKLVRLSVTQPELVNKKPASLDEQVLIVLGLPLMKGPVRTSAWSRKLSNEQINYAVTDAYAGFRLYHELESMRKAMNPQPPSPARYELAQPIILGNGSPAPKRRTRERLAGLMAETANVQAVAYDSPEDSEDTIATSYDGRLGASVEHCSVLDQASSAEHDDTNDLEDDEDEQDPPLDDGGQSAPNPRLTAVEAWVKSYRAQRDQCSRSSRGPGPAAMRAYALWHHHGLSTGEIARFLRSPPLKEATINAYIIEAVALDRQLPFDQDRLRAIFRCLPGVVAVRFKNVARAMGMI